jgi:ATP-dependent Zn protease
LKRKLNSLFKNEIKNEIEMEVLVEQNIIESQDFGNKNEMDGVIVELEKKNGFGSVLYISFIPILLFISSFYFFKKK